MTLTLDQVMRMKVGGPLRVRHWQWGWTDGILLQKPSGKGSRTQGKAMVQVRCMDERFPTTLDNLSRPTASAISTVPTVSPDASLHSAPDAYAVLQRGAVHAAATEYCLLAASSAEGFLHSEFFVVLSSTRLPPQLHTPSAATATLQLSTPHRVMNTLLSSKQLWRAERGEKIKLEVFAGTLNVCSGPVRGGQKAIASGTKHSLTGSSYDEVSGEFVLTFGENSSFTLQMGFLGNSSPSTRPAECPQPGWSFEGWAVPPLAIVRDGAAEVIHSLERACSKV